RTARSGRDRANVHGRLPAAPLGVDLRSGPAPVGGEVLIRQEIIDRVLARRGRLHLYDRLDAKRTALLVIDMQNAFVAPGAPIEVPHAREIVPTINRLAAKVRERGAPVVWVLHQNAADGRDWERFFGCFVAAENRSRAAQALAAGSPLPRLWP